ncbi:hypothetical protein DSM106972_038220 [Dulcicalothrix desertica PCC 7102]|uniref:Endonuclease/exonuclease/phosphatase domain-containing protein n=1 Tax=Dulcicalothrix desertica PCC 7102 TaxID=232991 RepID=A0A3S1D7J0_9CYAN|nr:hypothetical protein [Dulcicalothrix desertica]RUT05001.1 hypothetical protein DSM106972_038220 [Dulcicalothrix desertica PCC 7102]TWH43434.1 Endonuclease/Exonuclease/phosphatase family protein [Dulcicalothrix desertica PCC 7102]
MYRKIAIIITQTILLFSVVLFSFTAQAEAKTPLRYLAINVGNASLTFGCWEYKLCREQDVQNIRNYIATWKPDVIMLSEVYRAEQLTGKSANGPILPKGYTGICASSRDRNTGAPAAWNAKNASHEHECIAWKVSRLSLIPSSAKSAYGRNDAYGRNYYRLLARKYDDENPNCNYDFTGFRAKLLLDSQTTITPVAVHPNSLNAKCRTEEISRYWSTLADSSHVIIGGDWNTSSDKELQQPETFVVNYSRGQHWNIAKHSGEYSAKYFFGKIKRKLDHTYSNFGTPCIDCGNFYSTASLPFGSALGGYDKHPRADGGKGLDHRQILVDLTIP